MVRQCLETIKTACKIVGIILHSTLLLSFTWNILFGMKVLRMMIKLKYDTAAMAVDNKDQKSMGIKEMLQYAAVWISACGFGVGVGIMEFAITTGANKSFFGYGNGVCFVSDEKAQLFFVVIPTAITVLVNMLTTASSVWLMRKITHDLHEEIATPHSLLTYCSRLMVFQSVQWLFGLIYYWYHSHVVLFIFSFLTSLEGVFIFTAVFTSKS